MKKSKISLLALIVVIVFIIGGVIFVFGPKAHQPLAENKNHDTDNDGLKDWEEELYKTNPNNPDTDADGYLDGEEVNSGHNPLVKAPGDEIVFHPLPLGEKYNITQKILSADVVNSILDSYIVQKGQYIIDHPEISTPETFSANTKTSTIDEMAKRAIIDSYPILMEKAQDAIAKMPEIFDIAINDKDIKISQDNSKEAVKIYLSQVSSILSSDVFFLQEQTLKAVTAAFKNSDFSKLDELIKLNDSKIEVAKGILVPSSWKEIHKKGLALTLLIRNIFVSFRDIQDDPLKAYAAFDKLDNFSNQWNELMKQAIDLAKSQEIELSI